MQKTLSRAVASLIAGSPPKEGHAALGEQTERQAARHETNGQKWLSKIINFA